MYVGPTEIDTECLRQGDILEAVPFPILDAELGVLGRVDHQESRPDLPYPRIVTIPREHRNRTDCVTAQMKLRFSPGAVLAHCCELELRNGKCLLPMIPIARLIAVKVSIANDAAKIASLRMNKDPRNPEDPGYIDYFYLAADDRLSNVEWVVDYCQISSVPGTEYGALLRRKVLQLSDRERVRFKIKLAAFIGGRLTDEELDLGLENPWRPAPPDEITD
jgi:hypothetical protein